MSKYLTLRADNGKYVSADQHKGNTLVADRSAIGPWETFLVVRGSSPPRHGDEISLVASNDKYVCADMNKGAILVADRDQVGPWEKFIILHSDGSSGEIRHGHAVSFKAPDNQRYVSADMNKGAILVADREKIDVWEKFIITIREHADLGGSFRNCKEFTIQNVPMKVCGEINATALTAKSELYISNSMVAEKTFSENAMMHVITFDPGILSHFISILPDNIPNLSADLIRGQVILVTSWYSRKMTARVTIDTKTGWTPPSLPDYPLGRWDWKNAYDEEHTVASWD